jgi:hypothetical protein
LSRLQRQRAPPPAQVDKLLEGGSETKFLLTCSYLEIYNEVLYDLLQPTKKSLPPRAGSHGALKGAEGGGLEIKEHASLGVFVKGLLELPVRNRKQLMGYLSAGSARRATAGTMMNARSSRSHSIFTISIQQQTRLPPAEEGGGEQKREVWSKLNLVDLAGSERASKSGAEHSR